MSLGLVIGLLVAVALVGIAITALKGQWLFLSAGFMTVGVAWWVAPFRLAQPNSWWARHLYSEDKRELARERYGPNGTFGAGRTRR
jgi:hypothetical protein